MAVDEKQLKTRGIWPGFRCTGWLAAGAVVGGEGWGGVGVRGLQTTL